MKTKHRKLPSRDLLHATFDYDFETGLLTRKSNGKPVKTLSKGYVVVNVQGRMYKAHRLIYFMFIGVDPKDKVIDHIDGDKSNNRLPNLRCVKHKINSRNTVWTRRCGIKPKPEKATLYFA